MNLKVESFFIEPKYNKIDKNELPIRECLIFDPFVCYCNLDIKCGIQVVDGLFRLSHIKIYRHTWPQETVEKCSSEVDLISFS